MKYLKLLLLLILPILTISQNNTSSSSPYEWNWTRDGIWEGAALAGTAGGVLIISKKDEFTAQ